MDGEQMVSSNDQKKLSRVFRALDNETKLSIISLLAEEGAKSVTDISKALKINFSTAHKYLEDLEDSGLVSSKQETKNRLKRMFSVRDFSINLSPRGMVSNKDWEGSAKGFKIVTDKSVIRSFNEVKFVKPYLEQGLPQPIVSAGVKYLGRHVYDGITLPELKHLFKKYLKNNINLINQTIDSLDENDVRSRTFASVLNLFHPTAIKKHMEGDLFISNLRYPKLRNCVIDIRGLSMHGIGGVAAKDLSTLLKQILHVLDESSEDTLPTYCLASFNYILAPFVERTTHLNARTLLAEFMTELANRKYNIYLELELGEIPKFLKDIPTIYRMHILDDKLKKNDKLNNYTPYQKTAHSIANIIADIIQEQDTNTVVPVIKCWNWDGLGVELNKLDTYYLANMNLNQKVGDKENVSFMGRLNRFGSLWKGWFGTSRTGEMQNVTLNLPRLALSSKSIQEFFKKTDVLVNQVIEYQLSMAELAVADFARNHVVSRKSVQKVQWDYIRVSDAAYSISMTGLNETVFLLSGKYLSANPDLGELILKHINGLIENKATNIRLSLKEETNPLIADRFHYLDSQNTNVKVSRYSAGVGCKEWAVAAKMHRHLPGGHFNTIKASDFKNIRDVLNSEVSLFRIV